ncbi:MAG TPA: phosphoribosylanthranilate isomerase [Candidatus Eisenbacteria bacterium]|nr:phosphoribosylanthranilate isomerase [Candidatus Eisenbacteria bacterium]
MRTRVKVCGLTNPADALMAREAGADFLGLILTESPRRVSMSEAKTIRAALPEDAAVIGVFADEDPETVAPFVRDLRLRAVQVSGWADREHGLDCEVWHVLRAAELPDPVTLPMIPLRTYLLDAHDAKLPGGTGARSDWTWARRCVEVGRRLIVAGGLHADNVAPLVRDVRPFGVDASSGLEAEVRRKDPRKVRAFLDRIREADRDRPKRS